MDRPSTLSFRRRHLPHWTVDERPYFVTVRLHGTLPASMVEEMKCEFAKLQSTNVPHSRIEQFKRKWFVAIEQQLDGASERLYLQVPAVAEVVSRSLQWLEQNRGWTIFASTIMPNHVHLLLQHLAGRNGELNADIGAVKGYTAKIANGLLGRSGRFWQEENFDHWIRDEAKFHSVVKYIHNNPVKAGLVSSSEEWKWTK